MKETAISESWNYINRKSKESREEHGPFGIDSVFSEKGKSKYGI